MATRGWLNLWAVVVAGLTAGCWLERAGDRGSLPASLVGPRSVALPRLAPGTSIEVRLLDTIPSTARFGEPWLGVTTRDLALADGTVVPAGSAVQGIVATGRAGTGQQARLVLRLVSISAHGRRVPLRAGIDRVTSARSATGAPSLPRGTRAAFRVL